LVTYRAVDQAADFPNKERRTRIHVREVFHLACMLTAPLFDTEQGFGDSPMYLSAHRLLCETFPDLPEQDIAILFSAVKSFHDTRQRARS
jgi:hypothetical protein